ncbi:MAG: DUF4286 family protein [Gemmatimonadales bacterium]
MLTYEVTAIVDSGLVEAYERYMRQQHIPDLLATGCFQAAVFERAGPERYRVALEASDDGLEHYLATHAPRVREDFASHFPRGVTLSREVWAAIQAWNPPPTI